MIVEFKKRGSSDEEVRDRLRHRETRSHFGDFEVARRAGGRSGAGAAGFDSDHHQRQGPPFGVRRASTDRTNSAVWSHRMTAASDEAALRTLAESTIWSPHVGCSASTTIDLDVPLNDLAVGSR